MEAQNGSVSAPPKRDYAQATDVENDNSSRTGLIDISNNNNASTLKRRASIFDNIERPSRRSNHDDATSSFSLASLTQESPSRRRRTTHKNKKQSSVSSFPCLDSNAKASPLSTSRSLFGSLLATTGFNTQDKSNCDTGISAGEAVASKTNESASCNTISTRQSLFGSVMQNVERSGDCDQSSSRTPTKKSKSLGKSHSHNETPTVRRKWSSFTPEQRRKGGAALFASPGGFKMMDYVNTFSPFKKSKNSASDSNLSAKSPASSESIEWKNTSLVQGVMDRSLPGSLKFDCFPARMVDSVLQKTPETNALGMSKFLRPLAATISNATTTTAEHGLAEWESGLFYWQHPAVHPSPFIPVPCKNSAAKGKSKTFNWKDDTMTTKKRRSTLNLADAKLPTEGSNSMALSVTNQTAYLLQQQKAFTRQRRTDWRQSFASLYGKWISQLQQLRECKCDTKQLDSVYFYSIGEDHVALFLGIQETKGVLPRIVVTSSSFLFRNKLRQLGVENLCLMESWNGHSKGTVFKEDMIEYGKARMDAKEPIRSKKPCSKDSNTGSAGKQILASPHRPTKEKQIGNSKNASPGDGSNSPLVKEELAALRRAQAFGQTVGADVTVSIRRKASETKMSLSSIPPLSVTGFNECRAFFEVYLNMGSSCCIPSSNGSTKTKDAKAAVDQRGLISTRDWKVPEDVPLLLCRGVGPFSNATIKSLAVRRDKHHAEPGSSESSDYHYATVEVHGGPVLPCAMKQLFSGMIQAMQEDKRCCSLKDFESDESGEETLIGSHNLILRPMPQPAQGEHKKQQTATRRGIIGTSHAHSLNQFHVSNAKEKLVDSQVLGMVVWDVAHQHAMAYKLESADPSMSPLQ